MSGTPQVFSSRAAYDALVATLIATGSVSDGTKIYWDVRPSARFETLEYRVTDVCLTIDEAVMIAGLVRALTRTAYEEFARGEPLADVRPEVLRAAKWRAARYGLDADLIDVSEGRARPAADMIERLLAHLRPALETDGNWEEVSALTRYTLARGNGAARQRAAFARADNFEAVVDLIVAETAKGTD